MNNLSLTKREMEALFKVFAGAAVLIFALIAVINVEEVKRDGAFAVWRFMSSALVVATLLLAYFTTNAWKRPWVAQRMGRPVVHGVWSGTLTSDYVSNGKTATKMPIVFVIRQTYLTLSLQSFTAGQEGESKLEALIHNAKTDAKRLSYVFELRRPYVAGSKLTSGAGDLKLQDNDQELKGLYWTDSPTHGSITLRRISNEVDGVSSFADALRKFPQIAHQQAPARTNR